jgi:hypothetical protein
LDLMASQQTDPKWLIEQRKKEVKIIKGWIKQYYNDLRTQGQNPLRTGQGHDLPEIFNFSLVLYTYRRYGII